MSRSTLPGRMIAFSRVQHNSRCCGWVARALQMAGMKSIFLVSLISANIFWTNGFGSFSATSFTVGIGLLLPESPGPASTHSRPDRSGANGGSATDILRILSNTASPTPRDDLGTRTDKPRRETFGEGCAGEARPPPQVMSRNVVIVGAGMGGLTAALRLARAGWGVQVLEARPRGTNHSGSGGLAAAFEVEGLSF